ncbi:MAG: VWA domain-containing protein [Acidimicrobiaceae bacterium]|nr:VWA domain-containing protein [Acidimicrobiaceae bacterium]
MMHGSADRELTAPAEVPAVVGESLLGLLNDFIAELRNAGIPVSITESVDAMKAVKHIGWADRKLLESALAATLVKNHMHLQAFRTVFNVYFSLRGPEYLLTGSSVSDGDAARFESDDNDWISVDSNDRNTVEQNFPEDPQRSSHDRLADFLYQALLQGEAEMLKAAASWAVRSYAGMEPGRPVGGAYYLYRTTRNMHLDSVLARLLASEQHTEGEVSDDFDDFNLLLSRDMYEQRIAELQDHIKDEINRRLVADRGVEAVAKTLRKTLPDDVDLMHATQTETETLNRAVYPLSRKLAARLTRRRRHGRTGSIDFRATMRRSLSYGGVPVELKFRKPRPHKPDIAVIADISGSVATFSRFTLQLLYALSSQFSNVRSFVFVDGLDDVSNFFEDSDSIEEAIDKVNTQADVVWMDGHSNYGHAFAVLWDNHRDAIGFRTTVLILGDARNNYHESGSEILFSMRRQVRHLYWLNPEPRSYWDTGDSIISSYSPACDGVFEVRNLRQFQAFVDYLA